MTRRRSIRRGATMVEFSLVAPIVFLLFFAAFEFSRLAVLRHSAQVAAFEAARRGIVPGATATIVQNHARGLLAKVGVQNATIQLTPATINNKTASLTVNVSVPLASNSWVPLQFLSVTNITAACTLRREKL